MLLIYKKSLLLVSRCQTHSFFLRQLHKHNWSKLCEQKLIYLPIVVVSHKALAHKTTVGFIVLSKEMGLSQKEHNRHNEPL